jgi:hypothetical protein
MRLKVMRTPPLSTVRLSWRELYSSGAFAQRELITSETLRDVARDRA